MYVKIWYSYEPIIGHILNPTLEHSYIVGLSWLNVPCHGLYTTAHNEILFIRNSCNGTSRVASMIILIGIVLRASCVCY
jgi:hypothetical protein